MTKEEIAAKYGNPMDFHVGKWAIVRSTGDGVKYGLVLAIEGQTVVLAHARQLYGWSSKFVLLELASFGPRKASEQRYGHPSAEPVRMLEACGILAVSDKAKEMIDEIKGEDHG